MRIVCGSFWGKSGPVDGIAADPIYLDVVRARPAERKRLPVETSRHAFAYVFAGAGKFCNASGPLAVPTESVGWARHRASVRGRQPLARYSSIAATKSSSRPARKASASCWSPGKPLKEPVAWYGPIVMNTQEQLRQAFEQLNEGTFLETAGK